MFLVIRTDWDDEDDDPSTFEAELAMLDEFEAETHQDRIGKRSILFRRFFLYSRRS